MNNFNKTWFLLTDKHRYYAVVLLFLMFIGGILEMLSVGMIIPILNLMIQDNFLNKYPTLIPLLNTLGNPSGELLIIIMMVSFLGLYIVKILYLTFLSWKQVSFVWAAQTDLSKRLFEGYLQLPYTFHLQHNSAQLIQNVLNGVALFSQTTLMASITLIIESLTAIGVSILLIYTEPYGSLLIVGVIGLISYGFSKNVRNYILRCGEYYQKHERMLIQYIQQGLGAIKDVKLFGCETHILKQYQEHNSNRAKYSRNKTMIEGLPRFLIELFAVLSLTVLVIVMVWQKKSQDTLLPILGLFAAGAFRLMPSINRILGAVQNVRYSLPVIDMLYNEFHLINSERLSLDDNFKKFSGTITLENVSFYYSNTAVSVLDDINLSIQRGTTIGFAGSSGAGKSTLINIILGLLEPSSGKISVDGVNIKNNLRNWQRQIGYVPQSIYLIDDTLRRNIAFGLPDEKIDEIAIQRAIRIAQLEKFIQDLPNGLNTIVGERGICLSGGQCQRVGIARALYNDPEILILDEATNSLDIITERSIMDIINEFKGEKTIIIIAHRLCTLEKCDHIFIIENGKKIKEGSPAVVLNIGTLGTTIS